MSDSPESASESTERSESAAPSESTASSGSPSLRDRVRTEPRPHAVAVIGALVAGVGLASLHWLGLIAAGALASLAAPTVRRGAGYALGAGVVCLAAFAASLGPAAGAASDMLPVVYVTVGAGLGLPLFGSLTRAVVP
ncbi:hypothetical protein SAMN04488067_10412 [Halorubrum xinjiangense]|uniref:Uncharacterized protein n=1 Tax=Halorubrum xinjiangense TaxID=261291 RepID=A0A1G7KM16_9EURY|nr:hypothetical protein [Halorubrum xinjiangense]SDF38247.1 hypothetical protein SAMN04488067_10412 [Halorubrum xinjiangense]